MVRFPSDHLDLKPVNADPSGLERYVRTLAEDLSPRDAAHPSGLEASASFVEEIFQQYTGRVTLQPYDAQGLNVRNVCARFGPAGGPRIIVGAHYDAAGPYPGADDNASGVAGLLELARLLSEDPPAADVELVSYPLEEPPFFMTRWMGSAVHARSLKASNVEVRAMIALEMIGYFSDEPNSQHFPLGPLMKPFYPTTGNFIAVVGKWGQGRLVREVRDGMRAATPLGVESLTAPRILPGITLSDHRSYWKQGYPAVMLTDTAFFRNANYHTPDDTPDTLDYDRMAQVVDGVLGAVDALAR